MILGELFSIFKSYNWLKQLLIFLIYLTCHLSTLANEVTNQTNQDQDWPQFLGPSRNGKSPLITNPSNWQDDLNLVWQAKTGEGYGSPTVSQNRLFLFDREDNLARLVCYRADIGEKIWEFDYLTDYQDLLGYNNGPRSSPSVDKDRVYIFGAEGMLHCLNISSGQLVWSVNTTKRFNVVQNFFGVGSSPILVGDLLIVTVGGSQSTASTDIYSVQDHLSGNGSGIVAFDKHSGHLVYQISDQLSSYASPIVTQIGSRLWGFAFMRSGLVGFDPVKGVVNFNFDWRAEKFESVNASSPVIISDHRPESKLVFISESYQIGSALLRVSNEGYQVVWKDLKKQRKKSLMLHWNTAIHHDGFLYGCSGQHTTGAELRCININNGAVVWSKRVDERMSLTAVSDYLIALGEFGTLLLIRLNSSHFDLCASHTLSETFGLKYPAWSAPVVANGFLYLRGRDHVYCFDLP